MTRARDIADQQDNLGGAVPPVVAGKNAIINGGFDVWQRGTSFSVPTDYSTYTVDRFICYRGGLNSGATISRQSTNDTTNLPFIRYCLRYQRNSGNSQTGELTLLSAIETSDSIRFAGRTVTLSFYARAGANYSPTSNALVVRLDSGTGTDQSIATGFTGQTAVINNSATLTTTWQRFTYTGNVAATATQLGFYVFAQATGTAGANDWFEITGIQVETGSVATPFSRAGGTIAGELAACQRYYFRNQNPLVTNAQIGGIGFTFSSTAGVNSIPLPVAMRVVPTSLDYSGLRPYDITAGSVLTLTSASIAGDSTQTTGTYTYVLSSGTANRMIRIDASATTGYIGFSAEL